MALNGIYNIGSKTARGFFIFEAGTAEFIKCIYLQISGKSSNKHLSTLTRHKTNLTDE